jgi:hypothetical protein
MVRTQWFQLSGSALPLVVEVTSLIDKEIGVIKL